MINQNLIEIYTDGSCNNKTKTNGGYGIILKCGQLEKHISKGQYINTTSARMEIKSAVEALKFIISKEIYKVKLYTDNQYLCYSISKEWALNWEKEGWIGRKNSDLLKELLIEIRKFPKNHVEFHWIKGHNNHRENEICDQLAAKGAKFTLIIDDKH